MLKPGSKICFNKETANTLNWTGSHKQLHGKTFHSRQKKLFRAPKLLERTLHLQCTRVNQFRHCCLSSSSAKCTGYDCITSIQNFVYLWLYPLSTITSGQGYYVYFSSAHGNGSEHYEQTNAQRNKKKHRITVSKHIKFKSAFYCTNACPTELHTISHTTSNQSISDDPNRMQLQSS